MKGREISSITVACFDSGSALPFTSNYSDMCYSSQNATVYPLNDTNRPIEAPVMGYLNPTYNTACPNSSTSNTSLQDTRLPKASSNSYAKRKTTHVQNQTRQQKKKVSNLSIHP